MEYVILINHVTSFIAVIYRCTTEILLDYRCIILYTYDRLVPVVDWNGMIDTIDELEHYIEITRAQKDAIRQVGEKYPWRITEYYASLMDRSDLSCPVRRQAVPSPEELDASYGVSDPLEETENTPVPGVIRVYPDRIAVIVTARCPVYCRHCLRKRFPRNGDQDLRGERLETVLSYIDGDRSIL